MSGTRQPLFPLIRRLAEPTTALLLKTSVTPNQLTWVSIILGLAGSAMLLIGTRSGDIACGLLFVASYILDNCDGDIARIKNLKSRYGATLDTAGDFVIHVAFFALLGISLWQRTDEDFWLWCGGVATIGNVINYVIGRIDDANMPSTSTSSEGEGFKYPARGDSFGKWMAFVFRELARADFCFIVLGLGFFNQLWVLLPLGALGAQAYWIAYFAVREEHYHV